MTIFLIPLPVSFQDTSVDGPQCSVSATWYCSSPIISVFGGGTLPWEAKVKSSETTPPLSPWLLRPERRRRRQWNRSTLVSNSSWSQARQCWDTRLPSKLYEARKQRWSSSLQTALLFVNLKSSTTLFLPSARSTTTLERIVIWVQLVESSTVSRYWVLPILVIQIFWRAMKKRN